MEWFLLNRRTGEAGGSDLSTTPIWLSAEAIQFFQPQGLGTRIYLNPGRSIPSTSSRNLTSCSAKAKAGDAGIPRLGVEQHDGKLAQKNFFNSRGACACRQIVDRRSPADMHLVSSG